MSDANWRGECALKVQVYGKKSVKAGAFVFPPTAGQSVRRSPRATACIVGKTGKDWEEELSVSTSCVSTAPRSLTPVKQWTRSLARRSQPRGRKAKSMCSGCALLPCLAPVPSPTTSCSDDSTAAAVDPDCGDAQLGRTNRGISYATRTRSWT